MSEQIVPKLKEAFTKVIRSLVKEEGDLRWAYTIEGRILQVKRRTALQKKRS